MSTWADHGHELIRRPEQTSDALRAALAVVAPGRLPEMRRTKDEAFAKALEWQSLSPVQSRVVAWARDIEIARRPDLATRRTRARNNLEHEDADVARAAPELRRAWRRDRVEITGEITENAQGQSMWMRARDIELLPTQPQLSDDDLRGGFWPDMTGGRDAVEYVEALRGDT